MSTILTMFGVAILIVAGIFRVLTKTEKINCASSKEVA